MDQLQKDENCMRMLDFARVDFGKEETDAVNRVMSGYWLASGNENESFEKEFASYIGTKHAICVNSGSSANLMALKALNLPKGTRVLSSACGFPATLAPILHCGLKPVLVDYDINTHNIDVGMVLDQLKRVKAAIFAHTMGSPVDMLTIMKEADKLGVTIIEDCCEAVGSKLGGKYLGSFGRLGTFSFYPAHQITALGGGGMITTSDTGIALELRSLRDWGKIHNWDDQYLGDNKTKYSGELGGIKYYKHYTYQTLGFNMKLPEANAAFGREQLKKLDTFSAKRIANYNFLKSQLEMVQDQFIDIKVVDGAEPSWFGFILTFKDTNMNRNDFSEFLEANNIRTRPFFAGNITRHIPFRKFEQDYSVADKLMRDSLFIGVWQGLSNEDLTYMADKIKEYVIARKT
jgi:CDP-6-deoxy-D-xylo-4-hexulose-3-dehydrase